MATVAGPPAVSANGVFKIVPGKNDRGEHVFSVIVKRTYDIVAGGAMRRHEVDHPLREIDAYYDDGDPERSTVQYEYELAPFKSAADVVVIGKAYAPRGAPAPYVTVGVSVAGYQKTLFVIGNRACVYQPNAAPVVSDPQPFTEMELRYENAYGGRDEKSVAEIPFFYPRNFLGKGVALRNVRDVVDGLWMPNIEDPNDMLTADRIIIGDPARWHLQPLPQGFGWRQRTWYPRSALLGAYPAFLVVGTVTTEETMGLLPSDHVALAKQSKLAPDEVRFSNGASYGMTFPMLRGDEPVTLHGLTRDGVLQFHLPAETPTITLDIGKGEHQLDASIHTVSIRPDDLEVDVIWRGALGYEGYRWLPKMMRLHAEVR
jgi:hypothetical protein